MRCGLLGKKLSHSYSTQIHKELGSYSYELFEVTPDQLKDFLFHSNFDGINVTVPYKKEVIPYLSELTEIAQNIGAVNTIIRKEDGRLIGHNTDYHGVQSMLKKAGLSVAEKKTLVLGSGGSSAAVCAVLREQGAHVVVISRNGKNHYQNLSRHADAALIINTTPVGMYPNNGDSPIDLNKFPKLEAVFDLIYNPARTQLLLDAEERGLITENGLWMLVSQAKNSAEYFTNCAISDELVAKIYAKQNWHTQNIVLIGMPGCGKTTIGFRLAQALNRPFVDADAQIESVTKMRIQEFIERYGEAEFRQIETEVLADLGKRSGIVLSTGGGCVTMERNYPLLHQNATIMWLQRDLHLLPTSGRPLSQSTNIQNLYSARKQMYQHFADHIIDNNATPEQTLSTLLSMEEIQ